VYIQKKGIPAGSRLLMDQLVRDVHTIWKPRKGPWPPIGPMRQFETRYLIMNYELMTDLTRHYVYSKRIYTHGLLLLRMTG
jgi:hypothetical protein